MFDAMEGEGAGRLARRPTAAEVRSFLASMAGPSSSLDDAERIELIGALEDLKAAAAAAQARETVAFVVSQRQAAAAQPSDTTVRPGRSSVRRSVASQIGLARRVSPSAGSHLVTLAETLTTDLPHTLDAMTAGSLSEWRAGLLARETACLDPADRRLVDTELADQVTGWADNRIVAEARRLVYRLDVAAALARHQSAVNRRRVGLRPGPEGMAYLTGLLPLTQGVACLAALRRAAESARAGGDERSSGQVMADTLVERVTGQSTAGATPVEIHLVMTDTSLFTDSPEPAQLVGHGPIPAPVARRLLTDLADDTATWLRRLYRHPATGQLIGVESTRRCFTGVRRTALIVRDDLCRTPWCGAPIRHADHVRRSADAGTSTDSNGQGLCEHCNYTKEAPGWASRAHPTLGAGDSVIITTPTGHTYISRPPPLPRRDPDPDPPDEIWRLTLPYAEARRLAEAA